MGTQVLTNFAKTFANRIEEIVCTIVNVFANIPKWTETTESGYLPSDRTLYLTVALDIELQY